MLSQSEMIEKPMTTESQKTVQIRQKIKEVFGWDCGMKDDLLLNRYTLTSDGDLIVIVK
jgi:phosphoribosylpyrophosphate synthetase